MRSVLLACMIAFRALGQNPGPPGSTLSGRVTNSATGAGIAGATVSVCVKFGDCFTEKGKQAVADEAGAFRIAGVADGQYLVLPSKEGFWPSNPTQAPIRVFGDTRMDVQMKPFANVRGRVLDPEGKPAPGIWVKLGDFEDQLTDENGEYAFEDLPPFSGLRFLLSATPRDASQKPPAGGGTAPQDGERIVTTYYPSVVDSDQAAEIDLQGGDLIGYDIRLRTAVARAVRGVVMDEDGKPVAHATVSLTKPGSGILTQVSGGDVNFGFGRTRIAGAQPVETKEDGTFAFPPVLEGDWNVRADLRSENRSVLSGVTAVRVSKLDAPGQDIENLEIRLRQPFEIEVTADWGDTPPATIPPNLGMFWPLDSPRIPAPGLRGFAGRYFIEPGTAPPGYYVAAAMLDNRDVLGQVVEISGPTSVKMIYQTGGSSVRGNVEKGANALVVLMADATPFARLGLSAWCDANGGFSIPDVPPGNYTIIAVPDFSAGASADFPSLLASSGKRVKVEAGAAAQVELRVTRP